MKLSDVNPDKVVRRQPPSGGCVLKLAEVVATDLTLEPAAFGRLCVETCQPACRCSCCQPAAFGRLCVETAVFGSYGKLPITSRLRAAVC